MADLSFIYDSAKGFSDIKIENGDFVLGDELQTAVEISLFTDRRATTEEAQRFQIGNTRQSRRGYWANTYKNNVQGSGLWLLQREKRTVENLARAKKFCTDSLEWLVREGIAASVDVAVQYQGTALVIAIAITKPDGQEAGFRYDFAWDSLEN